jgi:hypothetical protein
VLARHVHRLAAGSQDRHLGRVAQHRFGQPCARADQVLAGVEDEQQLAAAQVVHDRVRLGSGLLPGQPETGRDGVRQQVRIEQSAQLGQADAIGELAAAPSRGPQRDARLPDAAGPVTVTSQAVPSNPSSMASSRWRPTNPVTSAGSSPGSRRINPRVIVPSLDNDIGGRRGPACGAIGPS